MPVNLPYIIDCLIVLGHWLPRELYSKGREIIDTVRFITTKSFLHPANRGTCFWSVSAAVYTVPALSAISTAAVLPTLFNFLGKPLMLISSNHTWLTYGCGKIFWHPFRWPWVKVTKLTKRNAIYLVPTVESEPLLQLLQNLVGTPPLSCVPPD